MRRFRLLFLVFALALLGAAGVARPARPAQRRARAADAPPGRGRARLRRDGARAVAPARARGGAAVRALRARRRRRRAWPFVVGHFQIDPDGSVAGARRARRRAGARRATRSSAPSAHYWRGADGGARGCRRSRQRRAACRARRSTSTQERRDDGRDRSAAPPSRSAGRTQKDVSAFDALRSLNKARRASGSARADYAARPTRRAAARRRWCGAPSAPARRRRSVDADGARSRDAALRAQAELAADGGARHRRAAPDALPHRGARRRAAIARECCSTSAARRLAARAGAGRRRPRATTPASSFATPLGRGRRRPPTPTAFVYQHRFAEPFDDLQRAPRAAPAAGRRQRDLRLRARRLCCSPPACSGSRRSTAWCRWS